jgi:GT2 family glycosyltransferase
MKRTKRPSILLGIPWHHPTDEFLVSLSSFIKDCEQHYDLEVVRVQDRQLVDAQNEIAEYFLKGNKDFLLFMEDDHSGFNRNFLKALLRANTEIVGINYYARYFPYYECLMKDLYPDRPLNRFGMTGHKSGYHNVDLSGFGMMLIKRSVFYKLDLPYFRLNKYGGQGSYATDIDFCDRCREVGINIFGCFDYILNHREVTPESVGQLRLEGYKNVGRIKEEYYKEKGYIV